MRTLWLSVFNERLQKCMLLHRLAWAVNRGPEYWKINRSCIKLIHQRDWSSLVYFNANLIIRLGSPYFKSLDGCDLGAWCSASYFGFLFSLNLFQAPTTPPLHMHATSIHTYRVIGYLTSKCEMYSTNYIRELQHFKIPFDGKCLSVWRLWFPPVTP